MKIVLHVLSNNDHTTLSKKINELKNMIRVNYRAEIYIVDSINDLLHWANLTSSSLTGEGKRTVIITKPEFIEVLDNLLISDSYLFINNDMESDDIVIECARFLSSSLLIRKKTEKGCIFLSKKEAKAIYDFYTENKATTKNKQNEKYRIMKKLNLRGFFQFFIWWRLTDILPHTKLKNTIIIK